MRILASLIEIGDSTLNFEIFRETHQNAHAPPMVYSTFALNSTVELSENPHIFSNTGIKWGVELSANKTHIFKEGMWN